MSARVLGKARLPKPNTRRAQSGDSWIVAVCPCGKGRIGGWSGCGAECDAGCGRRARLLEECEGRVTLEWIRVPFLQDPAWDERRGLGKMVGVSAYSDEHCCFCFRPIRDLRRAARLQLTRTPDGEWWAIDPASTVRADEEKDFGRFILPIGDACLDNHPEWRFALVREPQQLPAARRAPSTPTPSTQETKK